MRDGTGSSDGSGAAVGLCGLALVLLGQPGEDVACMLIQDSARQTAAPGGLGQQCIFVVSRLCFGNDDGHGMLRGERTGEAERSPNRSIRAMTQINKTGWVTPL